MSSLLFLILGLRFFVGMVVYGPSVVGSLGLLVPMYSWFVLIVKVTT